MENAIISKSKNQNHDYVHAVNLRNVENINNHSDANHRNDIENIIINNDSEKNKSIVNSKYSDNKLLKDDADSVTNNNINCIQSSSLHESLHNINNSVNKHNFVNNSNTENNNLLIIEESNFSEIVNQDTLLNDKDANIEEKNNSKVTEKNCNENLSLMNAENALEIETIITNSDLEKTDEISYKGDQEKNYIDICNIIDDNTSQSSEDAFFKNATSNILDSGEPMDIDEAFEPEPSESNSSVDISQNLNESNSINEKINFIENNDLSSSSVEKEVNIDIVSDKMHASITSSSNVSSVEKIIDQSKSESEEQIVKDSTNNSTTNCNETCQSVKDTNCDESMSVIPVSTEDKNINEIKENENNDLQRESVQNRDTEILHVDENDEDSEMIVELTESDPFAQESEDVSLDKENTTNKEVNVDDITDVSPPMNLLEENEISQDSPSKNTDDSGKASSSTEVTDQNSAEKEVDDENCIIPDSVTNDTENKEIKVINKQIRKFDITPVRLEKLIDPNKLSSSKSELEIDRNSTGRPQRLAAKKAESQIKEIVAQTEIEPEEPDQNAVCCRCSRLRLCKFISSMNTYACKENCYNILTDKKSLPAPVRVVRTPKTHQQLLQPLQSKSGANLPDTIHFLRKCGYCGLHNIAEDKSLSWEALDFCNEDCMSRYQTQNGSSCAYCNHTVQHVSMGKYAVRFGLEARQFCSGGCLEEFKKGLKSCSYCQLDITKSTNSVVVSISDKPSSVKEFCSQTCADKYDRMNSNLPPLTIIDTCTVCANKKSVEVQILAKDKTHSLCSDVCFRAFKYANGITETDQCHICKKFYQDIDLDSYFVFHEDCPYHFCSKVCMNVFILFKRKIVPCNWCKVKKYNFDMIKKPLIGGGSIIMCSLNCLALYQVSVSASSARKMKCDLCSNFAYAQYHLTMSDATIRNFCSYNCVMVYQTQYNKSSVSMLDTTKTNVIPVPVPLGGPKKAIVLPKTTFTTAGNSVVQKPIVSVANGLLSTSTGTLKIGNSLSVTTTSSSNLSPAITSTTSVQVQTQTKYIQQILVKPSEPKECANKFTQCRPSMLTKSVSCRPTLSSKETETDEFSKHPAIVPVPVPIYVPAPMHMFTTPFPVPVPFPVPIPVPIFIPTSQKTYKGVMSYMKEILDKTPSNPFEADLLLMAKMVAGEEKQEDAEEVTKINSSDEDDTHYADTAADLSDAENFPENENSVTNNFNDEVLQMAMKMATEQLSNSPTVDLEAELTSNTITPQTQVEENCTPPDVPEVPIERPRTRKRTQKANSELTARKRSKQQPSTVSETENQPPTNVVPRINESPPLTESERPDASMCLKFIIGLRAWKQWILTKNEQLEQAAAAANKKAKPFNTNILKLTTDELNYLLCLFVKEVRKPNGTEYAPDTIYYLCLSIQQYLFENGRIDNIFTDSFYEPFTNALDDVAKKFSEVNDSTQFVVTRVEEEHLWESKQLGAHSPHVLLATLMFFNTKYFNLATLEEHMQLSFSHIMKHWKRNLNTSIGKPGSPAPNRNVVLRFYPPQAALDAPNSRKKKVYEQHENEVNPLRCPVKLYEFYLSKCPESVKQRNDVFYLQPERSCVPDSPVWYSTMPLQKDLLMKMLHRIRMVKEVNISLLAS